LPADRFLLDRQGWVQFGTAVLLAGAAYVQFLRLGDSATITQGMGVALLVLLAWYLWQSVQWSRAHVRLIAVQKHESIEQAEAEESTAVDVDLVTEHAPHGMLALLVRGFIGLALVLVGSEVAVYAVKLLAVRLGVPDVVISATLLALGTSTPELVVGMLALRRGHPELLVGNVIGADVLNILFVTGASAVAAPLHVVDSAASVPNIFLILHLPVMLGVLLYFRLCIVRAGRQGHFDRWMGWPLVAAYFGFVVASLVIGASG
jgi:cation:H+ antiporter